MKTQPTATADQTFIVDDKLSLSIFCIKLEQFMLTERDYVEGSLVVSLNAPFGAGKSTFLAMWRNSLLERRKKDPQLPQPIVLNTWEDDHCGDPLLAIISALSSQISVSGTAKTKIQAVRDAAKDVFWMGLGLGNSFISDTVGVDPIAAGEFAEKKRSDRENAEDPRIDALAAFEKRKAALVHLRALLGEVFSETSALIMIDELDRCRPDYAVNFLEAVKHLFFTANVSFVLAVDKVQLRSSAGTLFGAELKFDEYYRKFAHRNVALPIPTSQNLGPLIRSSYERFTRAEARSTGISHFKDDGHILDVIQKMTIGLQMTPRQIQEFFRILGHLMTAPSGKQAGIFWGYRAAAVLMAGYSVTNSDFYHAFGQGRVTWKEIAESLRSAFRDDTVFVWMLMLVISGGATEPRSLGELISQFPFKSMKEFASEEALKGELKGFSEAWGYGGGRSTPFRLPYEYLESLKQFTE